MAAGKQVLHLDPAKAAAVNLAVLRRRVDRAVTSIVASASHSCAYGYYPSDGGWVKKPIEGPLFLVARSEAPMMRLILLNRLTPTNLMHDVDIGTATSVSDGMLSLKASDGSVSGIWFYNQPELASMRGVIKAHVKALKNGTAPSPALTAASPPLLPSTPDTPGGGLLAMLKGEGTPATTPARPPSAGVGTPGGPVGSLAGTMATAAAEAVGGGGVVTPLALSKAALKNVLLDLMDDPGFLDQLHSRFIYAIKASGRPVPTADAPAPATGGKKGKGKGRGKGKKGKA